MVAETTSKKVNESCTYTTEAVNPILRALPNCDLNSNIDITTLCSDISYELKELPTL